MPLMTKKPVCASCPSWLASGLLHWPQSPRPTSSSEGWEQVASSTRLLYTLFGPGREVRVRYDISKIYVASVECRA